MEDNKKDLYDYITESNILELNNKTISLDTDKNNKLLIEFINLPITKKMFKKDDKKIKAYLMFTNESNNTEIYPITDFKKQYMKDKDKKEYNWLDKAFFIHKGKPMFWVYNNMLISVDSVKTENEEFVIIFNPESWYNIYNNVVTSKLTMGGETALGGFLGKYWKIMVLIAFLVIGYLTSTGSISLS